ARAAEHDRRAVDEVRRHHEAQTRAPRALLRHRQRELALHGHADQRPAETEGRLPGLAHPSRSRQRAHRGRAGHVGGADVRAAAVRLPRRRRLPVRAPMTALPEIENRFDVIAKLGEGGMGCVYKVRHRDLDEVQIVKTLQAHLSSNEGLRERFVNEARRGMRLRHPHIAGVHDFAVCADGTGYIVMEYVHGLNLNELLQTKGPLSVPLVGAIAMQTLDALAYLHSENIVHRDISPDNLILMTTADGHPFVKLIDLGISKSLEAGQSMTATGQFLGKVHYASPEQFGGELDGRSDLYSLGIVLYKLLTNQDPIIGENWKEIISGHLFQPPRPFEVTAPGIQIP